MSGDSDIEWAKMVPRNGDGGMDVASKGMQVQNV